MLFSSGNIFIKIFNLFMNKPAGMHSGFWQHRNVAIDASKTSGPNPDSVPPGFPLGLYLLRVSKLSFVEDYASQK